MKLSTAFNLEEQIKRIVIVKYKSTKVNFSHLAVFDRDDNCCQYWHYNDDQPFIYKCNEMDRTIDHIIPRPI